MFDPARERIREWGVRRALYWQFMHALKKVFGLHLHYANVGADRDDLRDPNPPAVDPEFVCKMGCKADFLPFVDKVPNLDAEFVEEAFARGDECSIVTHRGQLVNFCFVSRGRTRVTPQLDVLVPEGFRYVYKGWTHPDFRRKHLSSLGSWLRNTQHHRPHEERSLSYVETHNFPSLLRSDKHPLRRSIRIGYVGWIDIFGHQIPFNSRKAKWIGFEFVRKDDTRVRQTY